MHHNPARKSVWERLVEGDTYGTLLILIVVAYVVMAVTEDSQVVADDRRRVLRRHAAPGAAHVARPREGHPRVAGARRRLVRGLGAVLAALDREPFIGAGHVTIALVIATPGVILYRIFRHPVINIETILGAIDAYMLLGISFAAVYRMLDDVDPHFFAQGAASGVKYLYFSFVVITTLGFGDLTPRTDIGRVIVSLEALLGQIFLVTVVAVLVSNLGRAARGLTAAGDGDVTDS